MPETLPALLSHSLAALEADYEDGHAPPLVVWSNVLRVLGDGHVHVRDLPALSRMSVRAVRISNQFLERDGLLTIADKVVRLTTSGSRALQNGQDRIDAIASTWPISLRDALEKVVRGIDVELPHYPTGYGQGDSSFTGGDSIPAEPGPPRIPAHGMEWPVVLRDVAAVGELPLSALLSQALIAFTIDYDAPGEGVFGGLNTAVRFFRHVPDTGITLAEAKQSGGVSGTGRSNFERHRLVTVDNGVVVLTPRGKRVRDAYPARAFAVEAEWCGRFGTSAIDGLRHELEALDIKGQPDFPDTNTWLRRNRARVRS